MENKPSILIVDDESANIKLLSHTLSPIYNVYAATNGKDALGVAEKHQPDIILLDIIMPDMDGYEVITALKKSERTNHIPVIFLTSKNDPESEARGLDLGAADYIFKPFSQSLLLKRVEIHLLLRNVKDSGIDDGK